jgi:hypothetical protein
VGQRTSWQAQPITLAPTFAEDVIDQPARVQLEVFLDEHRTVINATLDGLT